MLQNSKVSATPLRDQPSSSAPTGVASISLGFVIIDHKESIVRYEVDVPVNDYEIQNLSSTQEELIAEIKKHKISYENLIDKVTLEIEDFVKKNNSNTSVR